MTGITSQLPGFSPQPSHATHLKGPWYQSTSLNQGPLPPGAVKVAVLDGVPWAEDAPQVVHGLS